MGNGGRHVKQAGLPSSALLESGISLQNSPMGGLLQREAGDSSSNKAQSH